MEKQERRDGRTILAGARALVSGASFAGLATAWWMNQLGYRVTVIELASGLRKGGTPVDIEGEAFAILARMGMQDAVRAKALPPRRLEFKNADDSTAGAVNADAVANDATGGRCEIHRDDLLDILFAAVEGSIEMLFGRSVTQIENGRDDVRVMFSDGSRQDYALVFGCDGNRSKIRRLAFGEPDDCSCFMGGYFFIKVVPATDLLPANMSQIFSVPGRTALLNGYHDQTDIALLFRTEDEIDYDHRDRAQQRRMIHEHFDGLGWKIPAMLDHLDADDDFYFDKVSQIRMPAWSTGRVVLVGDAACCVSPVAGMGGSLAIIGAARLAEALEHHGLDHDVAFHEYENRLRPFVEDVQDKAVRFGMALMFPSSDADIAERNRKLNEGTMDL